MNRLLIRFSRKLRMRSFFTRIFLAQVFVMGLLLGTFYLYTASLFSRHYAEQLEEAISGMLRNSSTAIDVSMLNMIHSMRQTLENRDVIRSMVTPNLQDYPRTVSVVHQLRSSVAGNILVRSAALYVPTDGTVFTYDGTIAGVEQSGWAEAIEAYRNGFRSTTYANGALVSHLRLLDERIFVYQDFFPQHLQSIGTLIFEIDAARFHEMVLGGDGEEGGDIYLFDRYGQPVFPGILDYRKMASKPGLVPEGRGGEYVQRSELSGLELIYLPGPGGLVRRAVPMRQVFFPFAAVVLLLSLPLSLYVSTRVYRPVKRLMTRLSPDGACADAGGELDYFGRVYADARERNERLRTAIEAISPAVLERLLQNLLLGREVERREIDATLSSLATPFTPDSRYTVILASLSTLASQQAPNGAVPTEVEVNLWTMAVREQIDAAKPEGMACCVLRIADAMLALVIRFDEALSPSDVRVAIGEARMCTAAAGHGQISLGQGEVYSHIDDLRFSYLEALEDLQHSRFYADVSDTSAGGDSADAADGVSEAGIPSRSYFSKRCEHIVQSLNEGNPARAADILRRVVEEAVSNAAGADESARLGGLFADCLLESLIVRKGSGFEEIVALREELGAALMEAPQDVGNRVRAFGKRVVAEIEACNNKRSRRYIRAAYEYVESHYANSSLSLNMTAEHVGLNASYFSRLFGEQTGKHFTDYLAELRVEKACELLLATDMPIKDIAYRTGFNSMQNHFRVFKKCKGMPPGEFRQQSKS